MIKHQPYNHTTELTITYREGRKVEDQQAQKLGCLLRSHDLSELPVIHLKGLIETQRADLISLST